MTIPSVFHISRSSAVCIACVLAACSTPPASNGANDASTLDALTMANASVPIDAPASADAPVTTDAAVRTRDMLVLTTGAFAPVNVSAPTTNMFFNNFVTAPGEHCAIRVDGPCYITDCFEHGTVPELVGVSAGEITAAHGSGPAVLSVDPGFGAIYPRDVSTTPLWAAGDTIVLRAVGEVIPAFSVTLTMPPRLVHTTPPMDTRSLTLDRTMPFTFTWSAPSTGTVFTSIQQGPKTGDARLRDLRIVCEFPASAGTATVPASVVGVLHPQAEVISTLLNLGTGDARDLPLAETGGYHVHATAIIATTINATAQ